MSSHNTNGNLHMTQSCWVNRTHRKSLCSLCRGGILNNKENPSKHGVFLLTTQTSRSSHRSLRFGSERGHRGWRHTDPRCGQTQDAPALGTFRPFLYETACQKCTLRNNGGEKKMAVRQRDIVNYSDRGLSEETQRSFLVWRFIANTLKLD